MGRGVVVWVDGFPRMARVGPRGLEVVDSGVNPFVESGGNPFVQAAPVSPLLTPPPPRHSPNPPIRFSPVTPNGAKIPKGPLLVTVWNGRTGLGLWVRWEVC